MNFQREDNTKVVLSYCGWEANTTIAEAITESLDVQKFCE